MAVTVGDTRDGIRQAAATVRDGGTVIYPTETCYGLGCDATDGDAVKRVYDIKERPREKGLTCIVSDVEMAEQYCRLSDRERAVVDAFMPGPVTLVAEKTGALPDVLNSAFVFRIPGSDTARQLADAAGVPVVATSANVSGGESRYRVDDIAADVRDAVDMVVDAGALDQLSPSTIVELRENNVVVHREGPVTREEIEDILDRGS